MTERERLRLMWELEWNLAKGEGTAEQQREWARRLIELRGVR
jgi:hypothetical protein